MGCCNQHPTVLQLLILNQQGLKIMKATYAIATYPAPVSITVHTPISKRSWFNMYDYKFAFTVTPIDVPRNRDGSQTYIIKMWCDGQEVEFYGDDDGYQYMDIVNRLDADERIVTRLVRFIANRW